MAGSGIERVVIATDLGADSADLFAHGLALALRAGAELFLVHVSDDAHPGASWHDLPTVRALLEQWGRLPTGASPAEFEALGIRIHPVEHRATDGDLASSVARRVAELKPDLLMLGTHQRSGFERLFAPSVAVPVANDVHRSTLFVSDRARGLVDPDTGELRLQRVLVPLTPDVPQQPLVDELVRMLESFGVSDVGFTFVHVGAELPPLPVLPTRTDWMWNSELRQGSVVEQILQAEIAHRADLIAMSTEGRHSFLDTLRGSTAERVVQRAGCPVLTVPV